jgi:hypothetical protein
MQTLIATKFELFIIDNFDCSYQKYFFYLKSESKLGKASHFNQIHQNFMETFQSNTSSTMMNSLFFCFHNSIRNDIQFNENNICKFN